MVVVVVAGGRGGNGGVVQVVARFHRQARGTAVQRRNGSVVRGENPDPNAACGSNARQCRELSTE